MARVAQEQELERWMKERGRLRIERARRNSLRGESNERRDIERPKEIKEERKT